jgi:hypothetical protein
LKEYIEQYKKLHKGPYGVTGPRLLDEIKPLVKGETVLDYGCGQSKLIDKLEEDLGIEGYRYDPAIEEYEKIPKRYFDTVICTDVLEHIPENEIYDTLKLINALAQCGVIFSVCTVPAVTFLPNGENAHCTVKPKDWWLSRIEEFFLLSYIKDIKGRRTEKAVKFICSS